MTPRNAREFSIFYKLPNTELPICPSSIFKELYMFVIATHIYKYPSFTLYIYVFIYINKKWIIYCFVYTSGTIEYRYHELERCGSVNRFKDICFFSV